MVAVMTTSCHMALTMWCIHVVCPCTSPYLKVVGNGPWAAAAVCGSSSLLLEMSSSWTIRPVCPRLKHVSVGVLDDVRQREVCTGCTLLITQRMPIRGWEWACPSEYRSTHNGVPLSATHLHIAFASGLTQYSSNL